MLSILLCDDQNDMLDYYGKMLRQLLDEHQIQARILNFSSGEELLEYMDKRKAMADIIYLDIQMDGRDGMETAKLLREKGCHAEIIFLTSADEYVYDSFQVEPLGYLVKSRTNKDKLGETLLKAVERVKWQELDCYYVETASYAEKILLKDIIYFSVNGRIVTLHQKNKDIDFYGRIDHVEKELEGKGFIRTHRSYLVNGNYIRRIDRDGAVINKDLLIPISTANYTKVKKEFSKYLLKNM